MKIMKTLKIMALALALLNTACLTEQNAQKSAAYSNVGLDGVNVKLASGGATAVYKPEFIVLSSAKNPEKKLRRGDFGYKMLPGEQEGLLYTIPTWGKAEGVIDSSKMHVEDGFNPETDRGFGKDRTANYYKAAKTKTIVAQSAKLEGDKVIWTFPEDADFILTATLTIPKDASTLARVDFEFTPKKAAWYSVGYIGAPETEVAEIEEIWQATIWQEKRFPNAPYLCEAYRCTIPGTLVQAKGVTTGMLADLKFLPFEPMPKDFNSQFGVMLVSPNGKAQSSIFAPVLGNDDSNMKSGVPFNFTF